MSDSERDHMESYNRVRNGAPPTTGPFYIHLGAPNGSQYRNGHPVTPVTPAMTPLVGPYTRFAPYRQQSTQVLLDRDRKITLAKEEAAATKMRAQTTPQMFVRRAVLSGLPVSRTPPTLKDMIVQAFNDLKPKCPRGVRFPRLLQHIRETFPISTNMNISLEYYVDKALNDMMRKGVVSQVYGSRPVQGTYLFLQDPASGHGLNLTVTGGSLVSTQASTARPGLNSHITRKPATGGSRMPWRNSVAFEERNATGDHSGVHEFNVNPVSKARKYLEREVISKSQAKALDVDFQKIQSGTPSGVNANHGFRSSLTLDPKDSMISSKVVPRQTSSKLAELRNCISRRKGLLTQIGARFSFFGNKACKVTPL